MEARQREVALYVRLILIYATTYKHGYWFTEITLKGYWFHREEYVSLISEIQQDILDPSARLSSTLRKAKVLAYQLGNPVFKAWVEHELDGYPGSEDLLPDYRRVGTRSYGGFTNGVRILRDVPIPPMCLPSAWQEYAESISFFQGIRSLESLAEGEDFVLRFPWPANQVALLEDLVYQGMACLDAYRVVSRSQLDQISDTVKNRLLTFLLELEQIEPNLGETSPADKSSIPDETITQVFNTVILGGHNVVGTGAPFSEGGSAMGDTFNMSGDFSGAILNTKSKLTDVIQSIGEIPSADDEAKNTLKQLIDQLNETLQQIPSDRAEEAEAVAESAKLLVEQASTENPNRTMIKITGDGLKQAAEKLAVVTPTVLAIATQIVTAVMAFTG